jgi:hypothetical protein
MSWIQRLSVADAHAAEQGNIKRLAYILRYDLAEFPFAEAAARALEYPDLPHIHESDRTKADDNGVTNGQRVFYKRFVDDLADLYVRLLKTLVAQVIPGDLVVQRIPTLRIHPPGGQAVNRFHVDADFGHQPGIINFWLPFTPAIGSSSVVLDAAAAGGNPGSDPAPDYRAVDLSPGELLRFDAINIQHGNFQNDMRTSRVSMDFRVIPADRYEERTDVSVAAKVPLRLGAYYVLLRAEDSPAETLASW